MSLESLYQLVDPGFKLPQAETVPMGGQLFLREVGDGLILATGILAPLPASVKVEHIYPVKVDVHYLKGEDHAQESRGMGLEGIMRSPWWRVKNPKRQ